MASNISNKRTYKEKNHIKTSDTAKVLENRPKTSEITDINCN